MKKMLLIIITLVNCSLMQGVIVLIENNTNKGVNIPIQNANSTCETIQYQYISANTSLECDVHVESMISKIKRNSKLDVIVTKNSIRIISQEDKN